MTPVLRYGARSEVGLVRDGNEDSLYAGPNLLAVADGMGGHAAGEVASAVAIATLAPLDEDAPPTDLTGSLDAALQKVNEHLRDMVAADSALEGMGTTLTAVLMSGSRAALMHVGDSRAYLFRDGQLARITRDHTLVQDLLDHGRISQEEAASHPQRSLITRALDGRDDVDPDLTDLQLQPGDRLLLCTDGLSGVVSEATLTEAMALDDPQTTVDRMVELALRGGGPDNVSVIVAHVLDDSRLSPESPLLGGSVALQADGDAPPPDTAAGRAALVHMRQRRRRRVTPRPAALARRRHRMLFVALPLALLVLVAAAVGAYAWVRSQWYVGAAAHQVAIYQGVDGTVAGFHLRSVRERTGLALRDLPSFERDRVNDDIAAASLNDARRIVAGLRSVACADYLASARPTPTPSRRPTRSGRHRRSVPRPSATPTAAASRTTPPGSPCGKVP